MTGFTMKYKKIISLHMRRKIIDSYARIAMKAKMFSGSLLDRIDGLEYMWPYCPSASILDIGSCDGLVAYEFARHGARIIHGFEIEASEIVFARRLFRDVPVEAKFIESDIARAGHDFVGMHGDVLLQSYDIVLFLGVYHHLRSRMRKDDMDRLVVSLLNLAEKWFVVRTDMIDHCERLAVSNGFEIVHDAPVVEGVGRLRIYQRSTSM